MTESILNTIKQMLGIAVGDTAFDTDVIVNINSAFMVLNQLGVGTETIFSISDNNTEWVSFLSDPTLYSAVKTYIYLKVKMAFDPPSTSFILSAYSDMIRELEWRLNVQVPIPPDPIVVDPNL
jgi:hypothetical protein